MGVIFGGIRCEIRCHLRADVDEHIRWSPDVASSGMSGFGGHPRTVVALGVGSSVNRFHLDEKDICTLWLPGLSIRDLGNVSEDISQRHRSQARSSCQKYYLLW